MDALSLSLKIFAALSLVIGLTNVVLGLKDSSLGKLSPKALRLLGALLLGFAVAAGVADFLAGKKDPSGSAPPGDAHISIESSVVVGETQAPINITNQTIERFDVHEADSPEQVAHKQRQAKRIVASEILYNLAHLDERLGLLETIVAPDEVKEQLDETRRKVAPALERIAQRDYERTLAEQRAALLRSSLTGAPLRIEQGEAALRLLAETGIDPGPVRGFYEQLGEVESLYGRLVDAVRAPAVASVADADEEGAELERLQALYTENLREAVRNQSLIAHVYGLSALRALDCDEGWLETQLSGFSRLAPRHSVSSLEAAKLLEKLRTVEQERLREKVELLMRRKAALERSLAVYGEIDAQLEVSKDDPWNVVVAKARSLRDLGRTGEAVAVFAEYGRMFERAHPGSQHYARTAQRFTLQMKDLGVDGGIYVWNVAPEGKAAKAGLRPGDIIVEHGSAPISDLSRMTEALANQSPGESVEIIYLRPNDTGGFQKLSTTIGQGPLGAELMPI